MTVQQNQEPLSMVEKVVEALSYHYDDDIKSLTEAARAAIEAMREPSEKVLDAGLMVFCELDGVCSSEFVLNEVHKAMIDAALKETNP